MLLEQEARLCSAGEIVLVIHKLVTMVEKIVVALILGWVQFLLNRIQQMLLDYTICTATFGNGAQIGKVTPCRAARIRRALPRARIASTAAAAGTTSLVTAGRRTATGTLRSIPRDCR